MTQTIIWRRTIVGGNAAVNPTFQFNRVFKGLARIEAYKDVRFQQASAGGAHLTFACVNYNIGANVLMWTNGRTIYIPRSVNWGNWGAGMEGCVTHEVGHAFSYVGNRHGTDGIMRPELVDPLCNFTQNDFTNWFKVPDRGGVRPWQEPNRWRAVTSLLTHNSETDKPMHLTDCGCHGHPSLWRRFLHLIERHEEKQIDE